MLARTGFVATRLVHETACERGEPRGIQVRPQALPQRLGDEQVPLAVDALHGRSGGSERRLAVIGEAHVVDSDEDVDDAVEHARDGARARIDLPSHLLDPALQLRVALAPAGVRLAVGAGVARVPLQPAAQVLDLVLAAVADARRRGAVGAVQLLEVAELAAEPRVLDEVPAIARHGLRVAGERLLGILHLARETHDGAIGLELRERRLEDLACALPPELVDEVHGHVVRRAETRVQRVGAAGCQSRDRLRIERLGPLHDGVAFDVDAAAARAPGELRVLPRRDRDARLAVELLELFEHDRARRHVDAEGEGLRREHDLHELAAEELFDDFFEGREQPRVVRSDAALEVVAPFPVAEHLEVVFVQGAGALFDDLADLVALFAGGQAQARTPHLLYGAVAARAAEDKEDRRQQVRSVEQLHHLRAVEPLGALHVRRAHGPPPAARRPLALRLVPALRADLLRLTVVLVPSAAPPADAHELLIHLRGRDAGAVVEQGQQVAAHEHVLFERHGPALRDDHLDGRVAVGTAAHGVEPVAELFGVRDRRR